MSKRLLVIAVFVIAFMALMPTLAFAAVVNFATDPPGGPGTGGGNGECWPWGFGRITATNGATWGDDSGDRYGMFDSVDASTVPAASTKYVAWVDKNPTVYAQYIELWDLTTNSTETLSFYKNRNTAIARPKYHCNTNDTTYTAGDNAWYLVITTPSLESTHSFRWNFLRGLKTNNGMTCVVYGNEDVADGYYQWDTNQQLLNWYYGHQYNLYNFHVPGADPVYEDFTFEFTPST